MTNQQNESRVPGSFRDPSGVLFRREGQLYRQIDHRYRHAYEHLMQSGLYAALVEGERLIPHEEVSVTPFVPDTAYKIIRPEHVSFISYPYEWSFSQLRHAALLTLAIQKQAVEYGMSLKDSSGYNIQFRNGRPTLIDTLSFELYEEGAPWVAYRQFCQHFLAPLALMAHTDIRLNQLLRAYIDGIPLDLASKLLPWRTHMKFSLLMHLHLHAKSQRHFAGKSVNLKTHQVNRRAFLALIDNLESCIRGLRWKSGGTTWADYYDDTNYSREAFAHKKGLVSEFLDLLHPSSVWDLGANVGVFSEIASEKGLATIAFDNDPSAIEHLYLRCRKQQNAALLPLFLDLTNPSPGIGWQLEERDSLLQRGPADTAMALALIHHLAIGNNVPFVLIAQFFSRICNTLIIEFIPKHDSQVQRLLTTRQDIFSDYTQEAFERDFSRYFTIQRLQAVQDSERILYAMTKNTL